LDHGLLHLAYSLLNMHYGHFLDYLLDLYDRHFDHFVNPLNVRHLNILWHNFSLNFGYVFDNLADLHLWDLDNLGHLLYVWHLNVPLDDIHSGHVHSLKVLQVAQR
jgi:hypothetical protein